IWATELTSAPGALRAMNTSLRTAARMRAKINSQIGGRSKMQMVAKGQAAGDSPQSHPQRSNKKVAGSTRLRRKLSRICHLDTSEIGLATRALDSSGTVEKSQLVICQSPRSQRCLRRL